MRQESGLQSTIPASSYLVCSLLETRPNQTRQVRSVKKHGIFDSAHVRSSLSGSPFFRILKYHSHQRCHACFIICSKSATANQVFPICKKLLKQLRAKKKILMVTGVERTKVIARKSTCTRTRTKVNTHNTSQIITKGLNFNKARWLNPSIKTHLLTESSSGAHLPIGTMSPFTSSAAAVRINTALQHRFCILWSMPTPIITSVHSSITPVPLLKVR